MPSVAYYAMGGGLGHLVRARAVLHTLALEADSIVITSSPYASDPRILGPSSVASPPQECTRHPQDLAGWLEETLHRLAPSQLFVDVFPGGLLGELARPLWPSGTRLTYVGRLLRWPVYRRRLSASLPWFDRAYVLEPLNPDHAEAIRASCGSVEELPLLDPPAPPLPPLPENAWVVLHSGPPHEVRELVAYARDLQRREGGHTDGTDIQIVGPPVDGVRGPAAPLPIFPAAGYFKHAAHVVTACGFNVMRQSVRARAHHHFMPFARALDDQFARAARRHTSGLLPGAAAE